MGEPEHRFGSRLEPRHRTGEQLRGPRNRQILGVGLKLRAEASTDIRRDRANLWFGNPERLRDVVSDVERNLCRDPGGERAGGVRHHADPVRLHRHRRDPLIEKPTLDHDLGTFERILVPIALERATDVRAEGRPEKRCAVARRILRIDHCLQRVVVDPDGLGSIGRLLAGPGDDDGHRFSDEPDHLAGEDLPSERSLQLLARPALDRARRRLCLETEVLRREHRRNTRHRACRTSVEAGYPRVGRDRPHEPCAQGAWNLDVLDVPTLAAKKPRIFRTQHEPSKRWAGHRSHSNGGPRARSRRQTGPASWVFPGEPASE